MRLLYAVALAGAIQTPVLAQEAAPAPGASAPAETVAPPSANESASAMRLICRGTGERNVLGFSSGTVFGRHHAVTGFGTNSQLDQFGEQMDIDIDGATGKVRVPRRFLPMLHGGAAGWFEVKDLVVADDAITGMVKINYGNHPKMRIDRRSGSMALDGKVGSFAGQCEKTDPNHRAF